MLAVLHLPEWRPRVVPRTAIRASEGRIKIFETPAMIRDGSCMKTVTVNVSEPVYEEFQAFAKRKDRKASELIREAMELYRQLHMQRRTTLRDRRPASVGGPILPVTAEDDVLGEMIHDARA